jgi:predicted Zn finger-like uncharacterized protein
MPTTVACPECGSKLRVPEGLSGQEVRCARCGATFTAPLSIADPPADSQQPFEIPPIPAPAPPPPEPDEDLALRLKLTLDDDSPAAARPSRTAPQIPDEEPPPLRPALNDEHDDLQDCPRCGKQLHRDYRRCPYCGEQLYRPNREPRENHGRRDAEPHRGGVIMALGIIAILTFGCPPVGMVLGILAWVLGQADLKRMKRGEIDPNGEGLTQAGWICGIIATTLGLLMLLTCGPVWLFAMLQPGGRW